ncbi:MAG: hypothetical protein DI539_19895 [Flavobacterium psychrophilum]|nr:MAG: hypothetical protein DI539_19895 [Flavobacterium psychrophilum]
MNSKTFLIRFALITGSVILSVILINVYVDIYGLFLGRKERKVYNNERTSKYLLSYRYIPENYDAIIIGPSLSANLNPRQIKGYTVYNSSIMGANISDLHYLISNIIERGNIKLAIICLDPYLTKDFGKKNVTINPKEYAGALGSTNLSKTYLMYFIRKYNLLPNSYAPDIIDENGWNNFELEMKDLHPEKIIEQKARLRQFEKTEINEEAYKELRTVLEELRTRHIKVVGYFSPVPYQLYSIGSDKYHSFETKIRKLFTTDDIVLNLNEEKYWPVTSDYRYFIDHGHLSASGQDFVLREIQNSLSKNDSINHLQ